MENQAKTKERLIVEVLEELQKELEGQEEPLIGAENLDEAMAYNRGIYTALSRIEQAITELSDTDSENYLNYQYKNRTIHIDREKFMKRRPDRNDIDRWICAWFLQGQPDLSAENMPAPDPDELAGKYSVEQIEHIVSHYLDIEVQDSDYYWKKYTHKEEDFDEDAFRKQCEDAAERMLKGQAGPEDFPETDNGRKLEILVETLFPSEEDELRKQGISVKEITLEERIARAKMPFIQ